MIRAALIALILAIAYFIILNSSFRAVSILSSYDMMDTYFDADVARIIQEWTSLEGVHHRTSVHPIIPFLMVPITTLVSSVTGASDASSAFVVISAASMANAVLIFLFAHMITSDNLISLLISCLFMSSASFVHWAGLPESFALGSLILTGCIVVTTRKANGSFVLHAVINISAFGVTVTNLVHSAIMTLLKLRWHLATLIVVASVAITTLINLLQWALLDDASVIFFLKIWHILWELNFTPISGYGGAEELEWAPFSNIRGMLISSMVAPEPETYSWVINDADKFMVQNQSVGVIGYSVFGLICVLNWLALLVIGAWGAIKNLGTYRSCVLFLAAGIAWQLALHTVYGIHSFLYAMHILPFFVALTVFSVMTPLRKISIGLIVTMIGLGGLNNFLQYQRAHDLLVEISQKISS